MSDLSDTRNKEINSIKDLLYQTQNSTFNKLNTINVHTNPDSQWREWPGTQETQGSAITSQESWDQASLWPESQEASGHMPCLGGQSAEKQPRPLLMTFPAQSWVHWPLVTHTCKRVGHQVNVVQDILLFQLWLPLKFFITVRQKKTATVTYRLWFKDRQIAKSFDWHACKMKKPYSTHLFTNFFVASLPSSGSHTCPKYCPTASAERDLSR